MLVNSGKGFCCKCCYFVQYELTIKIYDNSLKYIVTCIHCVA